MKILKIWYRTNATKHDHGIVKIQATTMFDATLHLIAFAFLAIQTQEIAQVIACVVLIGTQKLEAVNKLTALAVSALNQSIGLSGIILLHIVFTILHHQVIVHSAIAKYADNITHRGGSAEVTRLTDNNKLTIIHIVFWASLAQCHSE